MTKTTFNGAACNMDVDAANSEMKRSVRMERSAQGFAFFLPLPFALPPTGFALGTMF